MLWNVIPGAATLFSFMGGEEFPLIFHDEAQENACARAEQLRVAFVEGPTKYNVSVIRFTASLGVATFKGYGQSGEVSIAAAENKYYASNYAVRNKVTALAA